MTYKTVYDRVTKRLPERSHQLSNAKRFTYVGGGVGAFVLLLAAITNLIGALAWLLFSLALLPLSWSVIVSMHFKQQQQATIAGVLIIGLLLLSFLPLYGEHVGEPGEVGGGVHRHSIWEIGHVH